MKEVLYAIVEELVENKDAIQITESEPDEEGIITLRIQVAEGDMGRVIGKQGRIAKAIRVIMKSAAMKENKKVNVEID